MEECAFCWFQILLLRTDLEVVKRKSCSWDCSASDTRSLFSGYCHLVWRMLLVQTVQCLQPQLTYSLFFLESQQLNSCAVPSLMAYSDILLINCCCYLDKEERDALLQHAGLYFRSNTVASGVLLLKEPLPCSHTSPQKKNSRSQLLNVWFEAEPNQESFKEGMEYTLGDFQSFCQIII